MIATQIETLKSEYDTRGYTALKGLFSPAEIASWGAECDRLLNSDWVDPQNIRTPYRMDSLQAPERIDPVVDVSALFEKLVADERILRPLSLIFGDEPLLFKDKIIFKLQGVAGYSMHQDWAWGWQGLCPADDILSVSIQIDGADESNGCIELFPGYQHELLTPSGMQTNFRDEEVAKIDPSTGEKMTTQPGDLLIFHSLTPHQSGRNIATYPRRSLYLTYNAARAGNLRGEYYAAYRERIGSYQTDSFFR